MNKKGQALVLVIILIPIILIVLAGVIEQASLAYQKSKITSNIKTIITTCYKKCDDEKIINLIKKNGINYNNIKIKNTDVLEINLSVKVDSFVGQVLNTDGYNLNIDLIGKKEDEKIVIKKG